MALAVHLHSHHSQLRSLVPSSERQRNPEDWRKRAPPRLTAERHSNTRGDLACSKHTRPQGPVAVLDLRLSYCPLSAQHNLTTVLWVLASAPSVCPEAADAPSLS